MPDDGYLQQVREITQRYGTLLIFDEVKTGITADWSGAAEEDRRVVGPRITVLSLFTGVFVAAVPVKVRRVSSP